MTRKEDVDEVRQVITKADEIKLRVISDSKKREAVEIEKRKYAEEKLKATGVVNLFQSLIDEEVVKGNARISMSGNLASLSFNCVGGDSWGAEGTRAYSNDFVRAYLKGFCLVIEGREKIRVGWRFNMRQAVGKAIVSPGRI